ncbi:MAG: hypothetical protein RBG13Loki_0245 [Promethearchaeota archaeon CR_4]|nr:MAG: hypothetical protein RBG13Loki_0245 [Candidatus Lokiarchaeota archaeon CR_4]
MRICRVTDQRPVSIPLGDPRGVDPLGVDIVTSGSTSLVLPGDDRTASVVTHDLGTELLTCRVADESPVTSPLGDPRRVNPLGVDIIC